jgi:hypothetical protein
MKSILGMVLAWIVCAAGPVAQGADSAFEPKAAGSSSGATSMSMELDADYGFVAGSKTHTGGHNLGEVTEQNSSFKFVASPEITKDLLFRAGVEWERFSFGLPNAAPLPNTLQRVDAVLGMDYQIDENWLMRLDVSPGVYSDFADVSMDDVNAPFVLGASYLADADLQWFVGLRVDVRSRYSVGNTPTNGRPDFSFPIRAWNTNSTRRCCCFWAPASRVARTGWRTTSAPVMASIPGPMAPCSTFSKCGQGRAFPGRRCPT